jgi:nitric oxide reductase subunit B
VRAVCRFLQTGPMNVLRWMRLIGDTTFALGVIVLGCFVLGLQTGHSYTERGYVVAGEPGVQKGAPPAA